MLPAPRRAGLEFVEKALTRLNGCLAGRNASVLAASRSAGSGQSREQDDRAGWSWLALVDPDHSMDAVGAAYLQQPLDQRAGNLNSAVVEALP